MKSEELKNLTLNTLVYHPFFGEGYPVIIGSNNILVKFKDINNEVSFCESGSVGLVRFIEELFLYPVKVVEI